MRRWARAAVVTGFGQPLEIREFPLLAPTGGAVLVRMEVATVCGTDVHFWQGHTARVRPPVIPGHEGVGRVVEVGAGVDRDSRGRTLRIGDRIIWGHGHCGACYPCTVLSDPTLCERRFVGMLAPPDKPPHLNATFAEYVHVHPSAGRIVVPDSVGAEIASAASCAVRSVMAAFDRCGPVDSRHSVLIQGSGPLGLFATAVAATRSARKIIVVGDPPARLAVASEMGADAVISIGEHPDPAQRLGLVRELTDGRGADVVFEFAGNGRAMAEGVDMAAPKGRYVMSGTLHAAPIPLSAADVIAKNLTIIGSLGATIGHYAQALDFVDNFADRFGWDQLLGPGRYPLDRATDALEASRTATDLKPIIDFGDGGS